MRIGNITINVLTRQQNQQLEKSRMYLKPQSIVIKTWKNGQMDQFTWREDLHPVNVDENVEFAISHCNELKRRREIDNYNVIAIPADGVRFVIK